MRIDSDPNLLDDTAPLTYTLHITNTGADGRHALITDTLPLSVTLDEASGGTLALPDGRVAVTWTAVITEPGGVWMGTLLVTVDEGTVGPLINLVEVTTEEGAMGEDRVTVNAGWYVYLPVVMRSLP